MITPPYIGGHKFRFGGHGGAWQHQEGGALCRALHLGEGGYRGIAHTRQVPMNRRGDSPGPCFAKHSIQLPTVPLGYGRWVWQRRGVSHVARWRSGVKCKKAWPLRVPVTTGPLFLPLAGNQPGLPHHHYRGSYA